MHMGRTLSFPTVQSHQDQRLPLPNREASGSGEKFSAPPPEALENDTAKPKSEPLSRGEDVSAASKHEEHVINDEDRDNPNEVEEMFLQSEHMIEEPPRVIFSTQAEDRIAPESIIRTDEVSAENQAASVVAAPPSAAFSTVVAAELSSKDLATHQPENHDGEIIFRPGSDTLRTSRNDSTAASRSDAAGHIPGLSAAGKPEGDFSNSGSSGDQQNLQDGPATQGGNLQDLAPFMAAETGQRAPINSPDTSAMAASRVKSLANHIIVQIAQSEDGDLDIHMSPDELGALKISFTKGERATLVIYAERPETLDLLRRNADSLQKELRDSGLSDFNLDFRWGDSQAGQDNQRPAILSSRILHDDHNKIDSLTPHSTKPFAQLQGRADNYENIDIRL